MTEPRNPTLFDVPVHSETGAPSAHFIYTELTLRDTLVASALSGTARRVHEFPLGESEKVAKDLVVAAEAIADRYLARRGGDTS